MAARAQEVLKLLRLLVKDNGRAQLAVAQHPGAVQVLVGLLGSAEGDVGNEAAETLAVLQHGNAEVQALVKEVAKGSSMQLD